MLRVFLVVHPNIHKLGRDTMCRHLSLVVPQLANAAEGYSEYLAEHIAEVTLVVMRI